MDGSSERAGSSHRLPHESGKGAADEIADSRHAGADEGCVDFYDGPVAELFVVVWWCCEFRRRGREENKGRGGNGTYRRCFLIRRI